MGCVGSSYEGPVPGQDNSYLALEKSGTEYGGGICIGHSFYEFDHASALHVASAVAVAMGVDTSDFTPVGDLDLVRLGKSIDLLARAHAVTERLLKQERRPRTISEIRVGARLQVPGVAGDVEVHDYSHVLDPEHRQRGYSIQVRHAQETGGRGWNPETLEAQLRLGRAQVGAVKAHLDPAEAGGKGGPVLAIQDAEIADGHQGLGLGQALYAGLMAHSYHHHGAREISGDLHSTMASRVHQRLAERYGMEYRPRVSQAKPEDPGDEAYDNRFDNYLYEIKSELDMAKTDKPGTANPAQGPKEPVAPAVQGFKKPPAPATGSGKIPKPKRPVAPGLKKLKLSEKEMTSPCPLCARPQLEEGRFRGCVCMRDLARDTVLVKTEAGYEITFGSDWDVDAVATLLESVGRKR